MPYDHVIGADVSSRPDWRGPYTSDTPFHEVFVLFGFLAAITNLELVTGVLILPQRQTVLVAKQAAEVDVLTRRPVPSGCRHRMERGRVPGARVGLPQPGTSVRGADRGAAVALDE